MNALIISKVGEVDIKLNAEAIAKRDSVVADAKENLSVEDNFSKLCATESWKELSAIAKSVEKAALEAQNKAQREAAEKLRIESEIAAKQLAQQTALAIESTQVVKPTIIKADGEVIKKVWKFEVEDLRLLVKSRPELCRIEANASEINKEIRLGKRQIPGLRIWEELQTEMRQ